MSTQQDVVVGSEVASAVNQSAGAFQSWYASEVPSIVTGLEGSREISSVTAASAWRLIDEGAYDRALSLVLREVF